MLRVSTRISERRGYLCSIDIAAISFYSSKSNSQNFFKLSHEPFTARSHQAFPNSLKIDSLGVTNMSGLNYLTISTYSSKDTVSLLSSLLKSSFFPLSELITCSFPHSPKVRIVGFGKFKYVWIEPYNFLSS